MELLRKQEEAERKRIAAENAKRFEEEQRREREKLAAEQAREERELECMEKEDLNVLTIVIPEPELEPEPEEEEDNQEELLAQEAAAHEAHLQAVAALEAAEKKKQKENLPLTATQKKMMRFLERIRVANERNMSHPRREDDDAKGVFFFPQAFGPDIRFRPFDEAPSDAGELVRVYMLVW